MRYYTRPEASNANNVKKFRRKTETDVLRKIDDLIQMLDTPELQTPELRAALAASRMTVARDPDGHAD
jgi:hypothetical protein